MATVGLKQKYLYSIALCRNTMQAQTGTVCCVRVWVCICRETIFLEGLWANNVSSTVLHAYIVS